MNCLKYIIVILLMISFSACEEVEKDFIYIEVTVTGVVEIVVLENNTLMMDKPVAGEPVEMKLIKAGGERLEEIGTTGNGGTTSITTVFNLYKEQPIEFIAKLVNYPEEIKKDILTWEVADRNAIRNKKGEPRKLTHKLQLTFGISKP